VNTQGIDSNRSWNNFVKLTEDARKRNQGIGVSDKAVSNVKKAVDNSSFTMTNNKVSAGRNVSFSTGAPKVETRILGGLFDTYV